MPFRHLYTRDQQAAAVAAFAARDGAKPGALPTPLGWSAGRRRDALASAWATLDLEGRVSAIAVHLGRFVPGDASSPEHVLTHGYEALCRTGALTAA